MVEKFVGKHRKLYKIWQIEGKIIKITFYKDYFKEFILYKNNF